MENVLEGKKVLHLTLKKKWFDMIASGEKKEEYREIKMYWWTRLVECGECYRNLDDSINNVLAPISEWKMIMSKSYDFICFKNGYSKNAPTLIVEFEGVEIGIPNPRWSDNWPENVFVIKLGEIITTKH